MDRRLLAVLRVLGPRRVGSGRAGRGDGRGVLGRHIELLPERRDRRGGDPLGEGLVVDEGDVEEPQAALAAGGVQVFAAV